MTITELYAKEQAYWRQQNLKFFGVSPVDDTKKLDYIQDVLNDCCDVYWNGTKKCILAQNIENGLLDHDANKLVANTFRLQLNPYNMCVDIFGVYLTPEETEYKIGSMPLPVVDLSWEINCAHFTPRITATRSNNNLVYKKDFSTVSGEYWTYDISTDTFTCVSHADKYKFDTTIENIFEHHLSIQSRALLQTCISEPLTINNFVEAMKKLPRIEANSIFNYTFSRLEYFFDIILHSGKYAQPTKNILFGANQLIRSQTTLYTTSDEHFDGCLVLTTSPISALENFRTVVNIYNGQYKPAFTYTDTCGFFDSFKTVTSGAAGRQRLLLDNISVNNNMLYVEQDGVEHNMFEFFGNPPKTRLSCLSSAPFCNNDKPKRIMMNAKLTAQSVPLLNENEHLRHTINARVALVDIDGLTYADSIVISQTFAKKLTTYSKDVVYIYNKPALLDSLKTVPAAELLDQLYPDVSPAILQSYENVNIDDIEYFGKHSARVHLSWTIPFMVGDKMTSLHGAKGTVGKIIPDDEMPKLRTTAGILEPGPVDVIFSGFSTMRRGSIGQIFEAWANASGLNIEDELIATAIDKYSDEMKTFANNSKIEYRGHIISAPIGILEVMRVCHHASTHLSVADTSSRKTLKLGEMEKLNLVANDCPAILTELSIRSFTKKAHAHELTSEIMTTRKLPKNTRTTLRSVSFMRALGYEILLDGESLVADIK